MSGSVSGTIGQLSSAVGGVSPGVGQISQLSGVFGGGASPTAGLGPWASGLQQASWRGLPFSVRSSQIRRGRKVAVHEYAFSDTVWVEDLGRGTRTITFSAFLIGDDVFAQRDAMAAAAEKAGVGWLVHPSLGGLHAVLTEFAAGERADLGRVVEIEFGFIQGQELPLYPVTAVSTQSATNTAADNAGTANWNSYNDNTVGTTSDSADTQAQYASIQQNMGQVSTAQTPQQAVAAVSSASPPTPVPDGMEQQYQGIAQGANTVNTAAPQTPQQAVAAVATAQPPAVGTSDLNAGSPGVTSWP